MPKYYSFLLLLFILWAQNARAQLADFVLQVTPIDEACPGNGSLNFNVSGTATGASVLYNIYKFPNLSTAIATVATNTLGGLTSGNYRVIATQSLNGQTNTQQADATIALTHVPLQYAVDVISCGGSSSVTVEMTQGIGTLYEIFSGPVTFPAQSSNEFSDLPNGSYQIRVYDSCGDGYASSFIVNALSAGLTIAAGTTSNSPLPSCDSILAMNLITATPGSAIFYPLSLSFTVYPPAGIPVVINTTINLGGSTASALATLPFFHDQQYSYDLTVTDACGNIYTRNNNIIDRQIDLLLSESIPECFKALTLQPIIYRPPYTVTFTSAPDGFNPSQYNPDHPGPFNAPTSYYDENAPFPAGVYVISITDACGRTATETIDFDPTTVLLPPSFNALPGCEIGFGSITGSTLNGLLTSVIITAAPETFPQELPFDVSFNIADGFFFMNTFPAGTYVFDTQTSCGRNDTASVVVTGYQKNFSATVTEGCDSFDLMINYSANLSQGRTFLLQKLDPVSNEWGHPATGVADSGIPTSDSGIVLLNNTLNSDLNYQGTFRVMLTYIISSNGDSLPTTCVEELYQFEFLNIPAIIEIASYACSPSSYDIFVDATGLGPLLYRIITKDGMPFVLENGTSNLFVGLEPGIYTFQVEDVCGNILNRVYDTTEPFAYVITSTGFCDGENGTLSVPAFTFINYEWWHESDPAVILSTAPTLEFTPFNSATDFGMYHVRIFAPDTTPSCIDFTVDYLMNAPGTLPNAGENQVENFCVNPGSINLFSLLAESTDTSGTWIDAATEMPLVGGTWNASNHVSGNFTFTYIVNGWCGAIDTSSLNIILAVAPEQPQAYVSGSTCEGENIELHAEGQAGSNYMWTGPNGFTSSEQSITIENSTPADSGTYYVSLISGNCASEPVAVEVVVNDMPAVIVQSACVDSNFVLTATLPNGTPTENIVFTWSGPENFSATGNPVTITRQPPGTYEVSIDSGTACPSTAEIMVEGSSCVIPLGISPNNDGNNDFFDLSGLNVQNLKIFNRYGMVVYEKKKYLKEWDGRDYNGNVLPSATYFYVVTLQSGEQHTGWVYLMI